MESILADKTKGNQRQILCLDRYIWKLVPPKLGHRLGCTRHTYEHLIKRNPPPVCFAYGVIITVKHIIGECPSYV